MSRKALLFLAYLNVVCAGAIFVLGRIGYGTAATVAFSEFRELQLRHAIGLNPTILKQVAEALHFDPDDIPSYLNEGFRSNLHVIEGAAVAFIVNAAILVGFGSRLSKPRAAEASTSV